MKPATRRHWPLRVRFWVLVLGLILTTDSTFLSCVSVLETGTGRMLLVLARNVAVADKFGCLVCAAGFLSALRLVYTPQLVRDKRIEMHTQGALRAAGGPDTKNTS